MNSQTDLLTAEGSQTYYENLYSGGYMDAWDTTAKSRLLDFVRSCDIPANCTVLDFGCGTGEIGAYIKDYLPNLTVWGADISTRALDSARRKHPTINFATIEALLKDQRRFDVVLTHHVLEHVHDLRGTLQKIAELTETHGIVIHAMPCGNLGSLEERIVVQMRGGKDPALGNRFVFEDYGHIRRLTSDELIEYCGATGLSFRRAWFGNQFWGAIDWITAGPMFLTFPNPMKARNVPAFIALFGWRLIFTGLGLLRAPAALRANYTIGDSSKWTAKRRLALALARPFVWLSKPFFQIFEKRADEEWLKQRVKSNGSSMYVMFQKE